MTFTGYFYTEKLTLGTEKWSHANTSINNSVKKHRYHTLILGHSCISSADVGTYIYMHDEDDPDTSYKILSGSAYDGDAGEIEYSGTDTSTPLYSAITASGSTFFDSAQDFDDHNVQWTLYYNAKVSDVPSGDSPYIRFKFYKVDTSDNETELFSTDAGVGIFKAFDGLTHSFYPSGSVSTSDRLLIKVYFGSSTPT